MGVGQTTELRSLQPVAQLRVVIPGEVTWTEAALEGPGTSVQAKVGLEVTGAAESPVAHLVETSTPSSPPSNGLRDTLATPTRLGNTSPKPSPCQCGPGSSSCGLEPVGRGLAFFFHFCLTLYE